MMENMFEEQNGISYDAETNRFTFTMLDDVQQMRKHYNKFPLFRKFVDREICAKREITHGLTHEVVSGYEVVGFLWNHRGEEYTVPREAL